AAAAHAKEYQNVFDGVYLDITREQAEGLLGLTEIKSIKPNTKVEITMLDSASMIRSEQVRDIGYTGEDVTIAIIDTGVDYTHPDLGGCFGQGCKVAGGYDFVNNDFDPMDDVGHGTHCAAIAAGDGALKGIASNAKIIAYKVINTEGEGYPVDIIEAIETAVDPNEDGDFSDHQDIISMSLGGLGNPDDPLSQAVDNAVAAGVVVVVSAGNSGPMGLPYCRHKETGSVSSICSPGTARDAITVGAVTKEETIADFSSRGPVELAEGGTINKPDIVAPGVDICAAQYDDYLDNSECFDDSHIVMSGTSMAAPQVAGAVALIKEAYPYLSPLEIKRLLMDNAVDLGFGVNHQGAGLIDVLSSITAEQRPDSKVSSEGTAPIEGFLYMRIDVRSGEVWEPYREVVNGEPYKIDVSKSLSLNEVWNPYKVTIPEPGQYRIHAAMKDSNKDIIKTTNGESLEHSWEFRVTELKATISLATLKEEYQANEPIQLTDPPEKITANAVANIVIENSIVAVFKDDPQFQPSGFSAKFNTISALNTEYGVMQSEMLLANPELQIYKLTIDGQADDLLEAYKKDPNVEYARKYKPGLEKEWQQELNNIKLSVNAAGASWAPSLTIPFIMTEEDKQALMGLRMDEPQSEEIRETFPDLNFQQQTFSRNTISYQTISQSILLGVGELPASFDWRGFHGEDYDTPVKDQGHCGSCWAFASMAALETSINAYYNDPDLDFDLSEEDLITCYYESGCCGVYPEQITEIFSNYLQETGVPTEECSPYMACDNSNQNCLGSSDDVDTCSDVIPCNTKCSDWQNSAWTTEDYKEVELTDDAEQNIDLIKRLLIEYGPVVVGMVVYSDFPSYSGGVYKPTTSSTLGGHAITIVGYSLDDGIDYWIVKNSWGPDWGEEGYFRIFAGESKIDSKYAIVPIHPISNMGLKPKCNDIDNDGYCYWGTGPRPDNCPVCHDTISDCDDSDNTIYQDCNRAHALGKLQISSEPDGAKVYIKELGGERYILRGQTPVTFRLNTGERDVRVVRFGYSEKKFDVIITPDKTTTMNVVLDLEPDFQQGWPVYGTNSMDNTFIANLDQGQSSQIIGGYQDEKIYNENKFNIWNSDGTNYANWPDTILEQFSTLGSSAFYDFDGDGELEIVRVQSPWEPSFHIYSYDRNTGKTEEISDESDFPDISQQEPMVWDNYILFRNDPVLSDEIWLYNQDTSEMTKIFETDRFIFSSDVSNGKAVWSKYISSLSVGTIYIYDIATGRLDSFATSSGAGTVVIYGDKIVWTQKSGDYLNIFLCDISTTEDIASWCKGEGLQQLTDIDNHQEYVDIYEDKIVWRELNRDGELKYDIYMYDISTGVETRITTNPDSNSYSPADIYENKIVYLVKKDREYYIYLYDIDKGEEQIIPTESGEKWEPTIYGNTIAWVQFDSGSLFDNELYTYNLDTGVITQISDILAAQSQYMTGDKIVYSGRESYWYNLVSFYEKDGSMFQPGFELVDPDYFYGSTPTVYDIDGDHEPEIAFGTIYNDQFGFFQIPKSIPKMFVFNLDGSLAEGWPYESTYQEYFVTSPAVANIDGVEGIELIASTLASGNGRIYAWHADGSLVAGWPVEIGAGGSFSDPTLADLDGDGDLEIIVGSEDGYLHVMNQDGTYFSNFPKYISESIN
ncbi:MAG: S8 family serine peptidase, partial [Nanoarchaeota archaeon]